MITKPISVAICYPSSDDVSSHFLLSLVKMLTRNTIPIATLANMASSRIAFNRNGLVELAKEANATHVLFIDSDTTFPATALERLLAHDRDIIGATASRRTDDNDAIGVTLDGERLKVPSPPVKMKLLGMPFMLIKMDVFEKLRKPWFAEPPRWMMGEENDPGLMPEDEYFCYTAIQEGYDVYCDIELSMEIGHRGPKTFYIMKPQND